jgi:hypothetical protein
VEIKYLDEAVVEEEPEEGGAHAAVEAMVALVTTERTVDSSDGQLVA